MGKRREGAGVLEPGPSGRPMHRGPAAVRRRCRYTWRPFLPRPRSNGRRPRSLESMGSAAGSDRTPKAPVCVYIIHHYWVPDVSSVGQLLQDLGAELVKRGFEVHGLAARPTYGKADAEQQDAPPREVRGGVH